MSLRESNSPTGQSFSYSDVRFICESAHIIRDACLRYARPPSGEREVRVKLLTHHLSILVKRINTRSALGILVILFMSAVAAFPGGARRQPPFDFSDSFYLANGINPANILHRVGSSTSASAFVVDNSNTDPNRNNIRITETTGGFDHSGNPLYYTINGFLMPNAFTNDAAGQKAMELANKIEAYIFPKASGDPLSPALSNRRQDNLFGTQFGYSTNSPLGIWIAVFVSYTPAAFSTANGRKTSPA